MSTTTSTPSILYHAKTLYLFTCSDFKTFLIPQIVFGVIAALSGSSLTTNATPNISSIILRIPQVVLWCWLNLLMFNLSNQRLPDAVEEDKCNKPFRPIPAGRITPAQATQLLIVGLPIVYLASEYLGGSKETSILLVLNWMYNDLNGGDASYLIRNIILAISIPLYGLGAARVATGINEHTLNSSMYTWSTIIALIILFTQQVQDLKDQEGDRSRNRKTMPLVAGDAFCRYTLVPLIFFWSVVCLVFWHASVYACVITTGLVLWCAIEILLYRTVKHDAKAYKIWALWLMSIYFLPLMG